MSGKNGTVVVESELSVDEQIRQLREELARNAEFIAQKDAEIAARDAEIAAAKTTKVVIVQTRREIYDEIVAAFADHPDLRALFEKHYLNVGWKALGRTVIGRDFVHAFGE